MPWVPSYKIIAGLLAGKKTPAGGSLQGLYDFPSVSRQQSGNVRFAQRNDFANDSWEGAFGTNCTEELINHAMAAYEGGNLGQWYLLAEIEVPNDEGAQYYKQSYAIEIKDDAGCSYAENRVSSGGMEYYCKWFRALWSYRVSRFQYDTPYSSYTRTDLSSNAVRSFGQGSRIVQGSADDVYYAFTGVWDWSRILMAVGSFVSSDNKDCFGVAMYGERSAIPTYRQPRPNPADRKGFSVIGQTVEWLDSLYGIFEPEEKDDPNEDDDNPGDEEEGGDGDHNRPVDPILVPEPRNGLTAATSGFITMYRLERQQMQWFAEDMYTDTLWDAIKLFFSNPIDFIVGCMILPYHPDVDEAFYPKFGPMASQTFSHSFLRVSAQYKQFDFGTISIEEYGRNCFDYSPYTKIMIWLPYIGYRELPTDEVMGKNIGVKYTCDALSGDCIAFITTQVKPHGLEPFKTVVIAQFTGNCGVQIPFGQASFDNFIRSSFDGAVSGVVGIGNAVSGNIPASTSQLAESTTGYITGLKPTVERGGLVGSSGGFNSVQYPYIIRTFPKQSLPSNYKEINGYPSNIGGKLSDGFDGLVVVEDIQLNNIPALEEEREEIIEFLKGGVLL